MIGKFLWNVDLICKRHSDLNNILFWQLGWIFISKCLNWTELLLLITLQGEIYVWHCERNMCEIIAINQKPSLCLWTLCRHSSSSQFHRNMKQELQSELMAAERRPVPNGQLWFCSAELMTSDTTTEGCSLWCWWHVEFLRFCSDLVSTSAITRLH